MFIIYIFYIDCDFKSICRRNALDMKKHNTHFARRLYFYFIIFEGI